MQHYFSVTEMHYLLYEYWIRRVLVVGLSSLLVCLSRPVICLGITVAQCCGETCSGVINTHTGKYVCMHTHTHCDILCWRLHLQLIWPTDVFIYTVQQRMYICSHGAYQLYQMHVQLLHSRVSTSTSWFSDYGKKTRVDHGEFHLARTFCGLLTISLPLK